MRPQEPPATSLWSPDRPDILTLLAQQSIVATRPLPRSSNATFLAELDGGSEGRGVAIYKPQRGESPLWDFPDGTLYLREYAAYHLSAALGWPDIPPTVIREGPYGIGSLQLFVESVPGSHYFTFASQQVFAAQRIAAFDILANNADRKSGHCLLGYDGRIWCIDQGLTFNTRSPLRTVIWEFAGQPLPEAIQEDLRRLRRGLEGGTPMGQEFEALIGASEAEALRRRLDGLLASGHFPLPSPYRHVPWPMI